MKTLRLCVGLMLVVSLFAGCDSRNNDIVSTPAPGVSSTLPSVSSAPDLLEEAESGLEEFASDVEEGASRLKDDVESALDLSRDESNPASLNESAPDESVTSAMSTDFAEIGALDAKKYGWGSGGPTDDVGRPNGATSYQEKFGKYDAYFIAPSSSKVYLTFDEGYENGYTSRILDTLKDKKVSAVFFITLDFAQKQPMLVQRMIEEGHVLGNHSFKHLSFPDMPLQEAAKDIMTVHEYVKNTFGYEMSLFRPPMGEFSEQSLALAQSLGYKSILWSFAYKDYDINNQPITIEALDTISSKCHPGAIYLLHAVSQTNSAVLGEAIDHMRELGFELAQWDIY